ncbi:MAG: ABC transporter ATP-binding protein [Acidobacteriota bacterium]
MMLVVEHLKRTFGDVRAVDDVSFTVAGGEIYGFVGPNGAGKTTTLKILATLDEPTSGDALLDGISLVEQPERARRTIGYMPDQLPTHRDISVADYLDFFARAYGLRSQERQRVLAELEAFTNLAGIRDKPIHTLSKGMKQRVSLARALVHDPDLLLLDEPAAGLDPRARVELRELLLALAGQGKAVLISSHILTELSEICHGAIILEHGRMMRAGPIRDLLRGPTRHTVVRLRALEAPGEAASGDDTPAAETPHPQSLAREALTAPGVASARPIGEELELDIAGDEAVAAEVLAYLVGRGVRVVEFRLRQGGLEDVFMNVTRGEVQ